MQLKQEQQNQLFYVLCTHRTLILLLFLLLSISVHAQDEDSLPVDLIYQSTSVGIGSVSIYDTYLSPQTYTGSGIGLMHEQIKMTGLMKNRLSVQHLFNLDIAGANNPTGTNSDLTVFMEYGYGMHYRFHPANRFQVLAGAQVDGIFGAIYNSRNGNNPTTAKVNINFNLSAIAAYRLEVKNQPIRLRYQVNIPAIGVLFSPHYGQSYYEISLGDNDRLFHFASFHNQLIMRNIFSVELSLKRTTLRFSYMNALYETNINNIQTKLFSNTFFIGFSKNFFTILGKEMTPKYNSVYE